MDFVQLLMISQAGQWTRTPSATFLHPKKWNAHICIIINFWFRPDWSMDSNPIHHPSPTIKMKCLFLDYAQLLMIGWAGWWTQTPSATHLQPKKWNAHFWILFNFWWSARLVNGLEPHLPPLSTQKNEMLIFGLCSTSDDWPGWLMDSNPIDHPSPGKKMKCLFLDYVQLLMIGWAARLTWTPSTTPLQPKTWNACFCITFNIWCWPDWSMDTNPICHPSSAKKMKCFFFGLCSTSDDWPGWSLDSNPIHHPLQPKNDMFIFGLCSTSDDWPGWSIHSNPICHPSPANKMKRSFLEYIHFWWATGLVNVLKPHLPALSSQKNEMLLFGLRSTSDDWLG